jgi:mannose-6-phosphate isomerase-like protein (cupin superfamily)
MLVKLSERTASSTPPAIASPNESPKDPAGAPAPALHEHPTTDEAFYCATGEASFKLGDEELSVAAGGLVFVPRGTVHTAWNTGSEDVRGIIFITPGDAEHEFVEV